MTSQEKLNLVTNYFAEDWTIEKAMQLLEDYEKEVEVQGGPLASLPPHHQDVVHAFADATHALRMGGKS